MSGSEVRVSVVGSKARVGTEAKVRVSSKIRVRCQGEGQVRLGVGVGVGVRSGSYTDIKPRRQSEEAITYHSWLTKH